MNLEKIVLAVLLSLFAAYFGAIFLPGTNYVFYLKPLLIPLFLVYVILKNGYIFTNRYFFFVILFYLGQTFMLFSDSSEAVLQLALVFYIMYYFALANLSWPLIRATHFKKIFTGITLFVILLNAFFLFLIVYIIIETTSDAVMNFIVILNAILALLLTISAVVYLSIDTSKKSILYFFGAVSLILSDIFSAINVYYLGVLALNVLEIILHFVGFYLIYLFIIEKQKPDEIDFLQS